MSHFSSVWLLSMELILGQSGKWLGTLILLRKEPPSPLPVSMLLLLSGTGAKVSRLGKSALNWKAMRTKSRE